MRSHYQTGGYNGEKLTRVVFEHPKSFYFDDEAKIAQSNGIISFDQLAI
jgi:hypothetical protein